MHGARTYDHKEKGCLGLLLPERELSKCGPVSAGLVNIEITGYRDASRQITKLSYNTSRQLVGNKFTLN